jgi:hypothetical protein
MAHCLMPNDGLSNSAWRHPHGPLEGIGLRARAVSFAQASAHESVQIAPAKSANSGFLAPTLSDFHLNGAFRYQKGSHRIDVDLKSIRPKARLCGSPPALGSHGVRHGPGRRSMKRKPVGAILAVAAVAVGLTVPAGTAVADKVKDCGTEETSPNNNAQGTPFITTETQTSACNSNSDTGETLTTTNRGGHPK